VPPVDEVPPDVGVPPVVEPPPVLLPPVVEPPPVALPPDVEVPPCVEVPPAAPPPAFDVPPVEPPSTVAAFPPVVVAGRVVVLAFVPQPVLKTVSAPSSVTLNRPSVLMS
jgi:hypothetical protein